MVCSKTAGGATPIWTLVKQLLRVAISLHVCALSPRTYPWPAFLCLLISFSPSMIHCMIFWFFSASSEGPDTSALALFPDSAFLAFLLELVPAFPLQKQDLGVTH